jgi:hypothetical protein
MSSYSVSSGLKSTLLETTLLAYEEPLDKYDIVIRFLAAEVVSLKKSFLVWFLKLVFLLL